MAYSNPILSGETLIRDAIKSENYVQGVSGWAIFRDGNAEFNDIIARGDITARSLSVPFVNQDNDTYHINIIEQNVDQPNIEFTFEGTTHPAWDDGNISVEAFDLAAAWGEMTMRPMMPSVPFIGNPPIFRMQSPRANLTTPGLVDFIGSLSNSGARPLFRVGSSFDVDMAALRHQHVEISTDLNLAAPAGAPEVGDGLCVYTGTYPASGVVTVHIYIRGNSAAVNGQCAAIFEIRDNNGSGTVRYAGDGNKRASVPRIQSVSGEGDYTETVTGLPTSGTMFIRMLYVATAGSAASYVHRTMDIMPSP